MTSYPVKIDFPAAHSMDTEWYAVDAHGRVARFSSGEEGAVPDEVADEGSSTDLSDQLQPIAMHHAVREGLLRIGQHITPSEDDEYGAHIYSLCTQEPRFAYHHATAPASMTPDGQVLLIAELSPDAEEFEAIHRDGTCKGCCRPSKILFTYDNDDDGEHGPNPYVLKMQPERPLMLSHLPVEVRDSETIVRFSNLDFTKNEKLQPLELVPCQTWGAEEYTTVSGEVRTIPGAKETNAQQHIETQAILRQQEAANTKPWWKFW